MGTPTEELRVYTVLERQPDYLRAIGTACVEIVNLEMMLADLLGAILRIPENAARAIYYAPQKHRPTNQDRKRGGCGNAGCLADLLTFPK